MNFEDIILSPSTEIVGPFQLSPKARESPTVITTTTPHPLPTVPLQRYSARLYMKKDEISSNQLNLGESPIIQTHSQQTAEREEEAGRGREARRFILQRVFPSKREIELVEEKEKLTKSSSKLRLSNPSMDQNNGKDHPESLEPSSIQSGCPTAKHPSQGNDSSVRFSISPSVIAPSRSSPSSISKGE